MASPQTEDGYLKIAREIVDQLCRSRIAGQQWQILWVVIRKTYGFQKKWDHISISQFSRLTGLDRRRCHNLLHSLIEQNIVTNNGDRKRPRYCFNKNYETWKLTPKKTLSPKKTQVVTKNGVKTVTKNGVYKRKKETIQKKGTISYTLAEHLFNLILKRNPKHKKPNLEKWAHYIDLMTRVDKRTPDEIREVMDWCQQDEFWQDNILSTAKLRKQFDQLYLKMQKEQPDKPVESEAFKRLKAQRERDGYVPPRQAFD